MILNMNKKEIITIAGAPGSGKSSTADLVAKKLNFKRFSSGEFMRKIAMEHGISLNELSKKAETDDSIDLKIDEEVRKVKELNHIVVDSRLAFHWMPESFKVFLDLPSEIAKDRIWNHLQDNKLRQDTEKSLTKDEVHGKITERLSSEQKRYMDLYGVDHINKENFDLVVDTNKNNLDEVVSLIVSKYKKWLKEN